MKIIFRTLRESSRYIKYSYEFTLISAEVSNFVKDAQLPNVDPLEKEMATYSSILAWKIPWMEKPGRLQSMGSQRVGHSWATEHTHTYCIIV